MESRDHIAMCNLIMVAIFAVYMFSGVTFATESDTFEVETAGGYQMTPGTSVELAKKVALFNAQRKAVEIAGRYLSRKSLIVPYESNRDEIYSLTAREIKSEILKEKIEAVGNTSTYRLRIRATVQATDFIKAEIENAKIEKKKHKSPITMKWNSIFRQKSIRGEILPRHIGCYERKNGELQ